MKQETPENLEQRTKKGFHSLKPLSIETKMNILQKVGYGLLATTIIVGLFAPAYLMENQKEKFNTMLKQQQYDSTPNIAYVVTDIDKDGFGPDVILRNKADDKVYVLFNNDSGELVYRDGQSEYKGLGEFMNKYGFIPTESSGPSDVPPIMIPIEGAVPSDVPPAMIPIEGAVPGDVPPARTP